MVDYKSICKNCKFVLSNLNYLDFDKIYEFNSIINYFVDETIKSKFDKNIKN